MPTYKLIYFDGRGRGEVIRLLFGLAGQEYEDFRFDFDNVSKHKPMAPFGQFPLLEIDGKLYAQSIAIANYLAREFGYYGNTNEERLQIDQVVHLASEFVNTGREGWWEPDEIKKAQLLKNFKQETIPKYMGFFEQLLLDNGTGYFVGNSITLADVVVYDFVNNIPNRVPGTRVDDDSPAVKSLCERVGNIDGIKSYVANRKPSWY